MPAARDIIYFYDVSSLGGEAMAMMLKVYEPGVQHTAAAAAIYTFRGCTLCTA